MTRQILFLSFLLLFLISACDFRDRPLSDADEVFERAIGLLEDKSYEKAETLFVQALPIFEQRGEVRMMGETNRHLGEILLAKKRPFNALEKFEASLRQIKAANDFRTELQVHTLIGDAYAVLGKYQDALSSYATALQLSAAFHDLNTKADVEMKMGSASYFSSRLEEALRSFQSSLSTYQASSSNVLAAEALRGIGQVYARQGRYPEALNSFSQARTLIEKENQPLLDAELQMNLGLVQKAQRNLNDALQLFRDAVNSLRSRRIGREHEVQLMFQIGTIYLENGRPSDAKKYFEDAISVARTVGDRIAEGYLQICVVLCDEQLLRANSRNQQVESLIQSYLKTAKFFQECGHYAGEEYALLQAGRWYENARNLPKAKELYQQAADLEEGTLGEFLQPEFHLVYQEYLNLSKERSESFNRLANVLLKLGNAEQALMLLEKASIRPLFSLLSQIDFAVRYPPLQEETKKARARLRELSLLQIELSSLLASNSDQREEQQMQSLRNRIENLRKEVREISNRIVSAYPNYEPLFRVGSMKLQDVQGSIPRGMLVVRFLPALDQLYVFAISKNRFEVRSSAVSKENLVATVEEYKRLLQDPSVYTGAASEASVPAMTRFANLSTQLYEYFLRPVDSMFEKNLVIIMSPEFENFPFQTIERQDRSGTVKYLVEITSVDYLPSLSSLKYRTGSSSRMQTIVAIGNPTGKNWSIDYELRDIRSFFKGAKVLISLEATWENLSNSPADILQLSTEFFWGEGKSPFGLIAFSDGQTPEELVKEPYERLVELRAFAIVVLSNEYGQGTGLTGAHAALLRMNGTPDVFFNAWHSDRKSAKFFSEFFYTHLANGLAPGDAYRQALLNLIRTKDVNHPHSWGQFFHFGVG